MTCCLTELDAHADKQRNRMDRTGNASTSGRSLAFPQAPQRDLPNSFWVFPDETQLKQATKAPLGKRKAPKGHIEDKENSEYITLLVRDKVWTNGIRMEPSMQHQSPWIQAFC